MSRPAKPQARSMSIRFTDAEREKLRDLAGSKSLTVHIRERALDGAGESRRVRQTPVRDADALGRLLALLGQSRLSSNLNQLVKAANQGSLPVTTELETDLSQACADIRDMRHLLLRALGMQILDAVQDRSSFADSFADAAGRIRR